MATLEKLSAHCRVEVDTSITSAAKAHGVPIPDNPTNEDSVGILAVKFLSRLATILGATLPDFIRLVRGQTTDDPRPNKDLYELRKPLSPELAEVWSRWNEVARDDVVPEWLPERPQRQRQRPRNHGSIDEHLDQVRRHIRKGQHDGRYLVVQASLADQWPEVFISPIGVVEKAGTDPPDIRIINDYSYPEGASVNDYTDRSHFPEISYNPPADIARRIATPRSKHPLERILLMLGDVAGAFRHVYVHADHARMFTFIIDDMLVVDLACGFGCGPIRLCPFLCPYRFLATAPSGVMITHVLNWTSDRGALWRISRFAGRWRLS
ncbi:hypothetical protein PR002_g11151 [Phytophthora rubi]|uniref:Uncharacterized protein n=1 Tax=Phytophthora rubi TaxID=129364 RepID=A0A6A3M0C1_9STRA|nr:hypothetical protein PR002_g11151 [Phytophthora rubi]